MHHSSTSGDGEAREPAAPGVARERRIVDLIGRALQLEGPERRRFLDRTCAGDDDLRAEIEGMLAIESSETSDFLSAPAVSGLVKPPDLKNRRVLARAVASKLAARSTEASLDRFGPYRVLETLGQGGMGTVYLAEQRKPIRRRVALKVLDSVHDRHRLKRFAAEGQALARLNHPNVASLYEVGATQDGRPFVAMEWVPGVAITDWCDERRLSVQERLELFLGVCAGVRHAHEKGILHRDLKPANVLVTEVDGQATAKVIDFGIARALDEPLLSDSSSEVMTQDNQIIGSPVYMCPEIAAGERDVDTRSDVYALGLVLYLLLVGELPFEARDRGLVELLKRIAQGNLPMPSARLAELALQRRQKLARRRGTHERDLQRQLTGDLDAITAKAIATDPDDRYSSPAELAADLRRHLAFEPVEARPATSLYLLGRFLRRRAGMVLVIALLILTLTVGFIARTQEARRANLEAQRASEQADRANREAERAREALAEARKVSRFLVDLFEIADPERQPGEPVDVHQLLDRGAERLEGELSDQPLARALFLHTIGELYTKMAHLEPAEKLVAEALAIRERELPANHGEVLASATQLGVILRHQQRFAEAEPLLRRVLEAQQAAANPETTAFALNNLGNLLWSQERYDEAAAMHQQVLTIRQRLLEPNDPELALTLNNLGVMYLNLERFQESREVLQQAARIYAEAWGTDHPQYATTLYNLAPVQEELGQWREAEEFGRQAMEIWQSAYGPVHPRTLSAQTRLASLMRRRGQFEESVALYRSALEAQEQALAPSDPGLPRTLTGLAISLAWLNHFDSAQIYFERALELHRQHRSEDHSMAVNAHSNLAWLTWRRGDAAEAEVAHRRVLEIRQRTRGPEHSTTAWTLHHLALAIADQGREAEAETLLRQALEIRRVALGENHREVGETVHELGRLAGRAGRIDEARELFDRALDIRHQALPPEHPDVQQTRSARQALERS